MTTVSWILIAALLIRSITDLCFKGAVHRLDFSSFSSIGSPMKTLIRTPLLWIALGLVGINFWFWIMVLSAYDLSYAYPLFSLSYVLIMIGGKVFFDEHIDGYKLAGIICIAGSMSLPHYP